MRPLTTLGTVIVAALGVASAGARAQEATVEPHVFKVGETEIDTELGRFLVPEDRTAPDSRQIELAYVRFPSTASQPGSPIVYLAGGPGGSGTGTAQGSRFSLFMALREVADVIAFDQRGTGLSQRLPPCSKADWSASFEDPVARQQLARMAEDTARFCAKEWRSQGISLDGYNTIESADDLETLREVLGAEKLSLWAISYGTHLALATLKRHPDSIDRLVLAGVEGPNQTYKLPNDQQWMLEQVAERIGEDPDLAELYPTFLEDVEVVLDRLRAKPEVTSVFVRGVGKVEMAVTAFDVQYAAAATLRGPETLRILPKAFAQMRQGDYSAIRFYLPISRSGSVRGMPSAMDSASAGTVERLAQLEQQAKETLLGDAINFPALAIRRGLGVRDLGDDFRRNLTSEVPTLFITGTLDGRTPPAHTAEVLPGFANASHLILDGAGHSDPLFLSSPEILSTMLDFLHGRPVLEERTIEVPVPTFRR